MVEEEKIVFSIKSKIKELQTTTVDKGLYKTYIILENGATIEFYRHIPIEDKVVGMQFDQFYMRYVGGKKRRLSDIYSYLDTMDEDGTFKRRNLTSDQLSEYIEFKISPRIE